MTQNEKNMDTPKETPLQDLMKDALDHYNEAGNAYLITGTMYYLAIEQYYKLKMLTDADIEAYADGLAHAESKKSFERGEWLGIKEGARAIREGKIVSSGTDDTK